MVTATAPNSDWQKALGGSMATLRRVAAYALPPALDRRILELGERKESLTADERAELLAWVEFTQQRSTDKWQAELALKSLTTAYPEFADRP